LKEETMDDIEAQNAQSIRMIHWCSYSLAVFAVTYFAVAAWGVLGFAAMCMFALAAGSLALEGLVGLGLVAIFAGIGVWILILP
jgi:hypothetical protein